LRNRKINVKGVKANIIIGDTFMNEEKINNTFLSLKEKRKALGLTLKDIFQRTRISIVNLEAIENGDLHLLPVPTYTRNFIKTYARTLDIDSKPILESYENYLSSLQIAETPSQENVPENISFLAKIGRYKAYLWTAAVLIFIVIVSLFISSQYQPATDINNNLAGKIAAIDPEKKADTLSPPTKATVPVNEQAKAIPQPVSNEINKTKQIPAQSNAIRQESAATQPRASSAQNTRALESSEEANLLIIKATEETWIRIKADQNPSYQILLKPGEKIERKAASFDMDIGNAGGIKIQFKGKNIENIGKSGEVIHLRLP
jgi:cytoskeleton protein RodZ